VAKQCLHKHSTLVQAWVDSDTELEIEAAIVAVKQCDMCGETLLDKEVDDIDDILTLPLIDLDFQRESLQRRWREVLVTINKESDY
jgi:hypothetical protein